MFLTDLIIVYFVTGIVMRVSGLSTVALLRNGGSSECGDLKSCVRCDRGGEKMMLPVEKLNASLYSDATTMNAVPIDDGPYRCIKCAHFIVFKTRECVDKCPPGYSEEWSTLIDYMGRVCTSKKNIVIAGISGQKLAIMLGISIGSLVCLVVIVSGFIYLKHRRRKTLQDKARLSPTLSHLTGTHRSQDSNDSERPEFLKQLAYLRPDAPIFLAMLNETRRQVRELRRSSRQTSAMQAYRPVLKDLSRILILLNKPEDRAGVSPADWETLLAWGERVLRRYKKQNPNQVAHLLGFSQLPVEDSESPILDPSPYPTHLTTFSASNDCKLRPTSCNSTNQLQQLAISAFDERYKNQASPWWTIQRWYEEMGEPKLRKFCAQTHKLAGHGEAVVSAVLIMQRRIIFDDPEYEMRRVDVVTYTIEEVIAPGKRRSYWNLMEGLRKDCVFYLDLVDKEQMIYKFHKHVCGIRWKHCGSEDESTNILKPEDIATLFVRPSSLLDSGVDVSSPHNTVGNRDWTAPDKSQSSTVLVEWNSNHISRRSCSHGLTDEDDFYTLGFRPQDEITTEL